MMLWLLFGQRIALDIEPGTNFTPFETIDRYMHLLSGGYSKALMHHAAVNLAGNVLLFVPLGIFLPGIWDTFKKFSRFFPMAALLILLVELVQLLTMLGSCDVDDLILNLSGTVVGFIFWRLFGK